MFVSVSLLVPLNSKTKAAVLTLLTQVKVPFNAIGLTSELTCLEFHCKCIEEEVGINYIP